MPSDAEKILSKLAPRQREAVTYVDGPLLVLAGAGSGKTRVLTHKAAWLIAAGLAAPWQILAVTFTNKAAGEMRERVSALVPRADEVQVSTFHAFGLRFLFRNKEETERILRIRPGFAVFDRGDSRALVKQILDEAKIDTKEVEPASVLDAISREKAAWSPGSRASLLEGLYLEVCQRYQKLLRERNAVDFDDLLIGPLQMLTADSDLLQRERRRIKWLLVDEYQDVNRPQYHLLRRLAGEGGRIMVVGDPDQSIYGWRGAEIGMILNFERDFQTAGRAPEASGDAGGEAEGTSPREAAGTSPREAETGRRKAHVIVLDENYRSSGNILGAANSLIRNNSARMEKNLRTARGAGEKVRALLAESDFQEADYIAAEIERLRAKDGYSYGDIALLYRQNAMSRLYEQKFLEAGIPYRVVRGIAFYERKEIRDVLAVLKAALNPADASAFERAAGLTVKGLGPKKTAELSAWAAGLGEFGAAAEAFWEALAEGKCPIRGQVGQALAELGKNMRKLLTLSGDIGAAIDHIMGAMGYEDLLRRKNPDDWEDRYENVMELRSIVPAGEDLAQALAEAALFTDADKNDPNEHRVVSLLTLHAAKGLEFPVVFLVGMEENVFPNYRAQDDPAQMEEERRLCYVGMTRAEERLYLTAAEERRLYGVTQDKGFSRFLYEISDEYKQVDERRERKGREKWKGGASRDEKYGYGRNRRRWGW
ncbi:MAG: UvrD-helicase domain-containing protein [Synergistaceae bacterium]|jgi:DNA helicase-2/ATP-dependent DNA helicase PcrA|nr:UvrD-helicase domain-containing protein [Synergistaceae bacterium]